MIYIFKYIKIPCLYCFCDKNKEYIEILQYIILKKCYNVNEIPYLIDTAVNKGQLDTLKYLYYIAEGTFRYHNMLNSAINNASRQENLETIKFLYSVWQSFRKAEQTCLQPTYRKMHTISIKTSMSLACAHGKLEVVKFFYSLGIKFPKCVIEVAKNQQHTNIIEFIESIQ